MIRATLGAAACFAALAASAYAIDPAIQVTVITVEGQAVPGVGNVSTVSNLAVNNAGTTLVEVDTDNANTDIDGALLRDGALYLQEGQLLAGPPGAGLGSFDAVTLNNAGNSGWNLFLDNTAGSSDDSGIYLNTTLLIQEGDVATAAGFSPGTPFLGFFETKINDSDDTLVIGTVDDPAIASTVDQFLMRVSAGGVQSLLLKEGDPIPGLASPFITTFGTSPHNFDQNAAGDVLVSVDTDDASATDGFILLNNVTVAREGSPSPIAGRLWSSLSGPELSLNDDGDVVFSGSLDGDSATNLAIDRNGQIYRQEGDSLPAFAPFKITSFGSGPILLANRGAPSEDADVLWYADWDDADTTIDTGLFLEDKRLLQEGVDLVSGTVIDDIRGIQDGYAMSDDGRYIAVRLNLVGSLDAAIRLDLGPWQKLGNGKPGSTAPKLRAFGQLAGGTATTVRLTRGVPGGVAHLIIGLSPLNIPFYGGTLVPSPDVVVLGLPLDADGALEFTTTFPSGVPAGAKIHMQYWIPDAGATLGFSASNAVVGTSQ